MAENVVCLACGSDPEKPFELGLKKHFRDHRETKGGWADFYLCEDVDGLMVEIERRRRMERRELMEDCVNLQRQNEAFYKDVQRLSAECEKRQQRAEEFKALVKLLRQENEALRLALAKDLFRYLRPQDVPQEYGP
jgi:hypothetical protein